jgi:hypothetical protein
MARLEDWENSQLQITNYQLLSVNCQLSTGLAVFFSK